MPIAFNSTLRTNRANLITTAIDAGPGPGRLNIYSGTRPATGGAIGAAVLLAELTFTDPAALSASSGVLTMSAINADTSANATGTATWFRVTDSTGAFVMDGDVGTSGSDLNLNSTSISTGQQVSITNFVITEGNA